MAVVRHQDIQIVGMIDVETGLVEDVQFEDCRIFGPAVLVFLEDVSLIGCSFDTRGWSDLAWIIAPSRTGLAGGVAVKSASFRRCQFIGIGLAIAEAQQDEMRAGFEGGGGPDASAG